MFPLKIEKFLSKMCKVKAQFIQFSASPSRKKSSMYSVKPLYLFMLFINWIKHQRLNTHTQKSWVFTYSLYLKPGQEVHKWRRSERAQRTPWWRWFKCRVSCSGEDLSAHPCHAPAVFNILVDDQHYWFYSSMRTNCHLDRPV